MMAELETPLSGFFGQAYNYDDQDMTEDWMNRFKDPGSKSASKDEVIRNQVRTRMELMLGQVHDRVCTASNMLNRPPLTMDVHIKEVSFETFNQKSAITPC